jgi:hypothetical protein
MDTSFHRVLIDAGNFAIILLTAVLGIGSYWLAFRVCTRQPTTRRIIGRRYRIRTAIRPAEPATAPPIGATGTKQRTRALVAGLALTGLYTIGIFVDLFELYITGATLLMAGALVLLYDARARRV